MKFTGDFICVLIDTKVLDSLEIEEIRGGGDFENHIDAIAVTGFWLWAVLLSPLLWTLFTILSLLYRTKMLIYQTFLCCKFRSNFESNVNPDLKALKIPHAGHNFDGGD